MIVDGIQEVGFGDFCSGLDIAIDKRCDRRYAIRYIDSKAVVAEDDRIGHEQCRLRTCTDTQTAYTNVTCVVCKCIVVELTDAQCHTAARASRPVVTHQGVETRTFVQEQTCTL